MYEATTLYCTVQCMYEVTTLYCTVQCMYEVTTLYCTVQCMYEVTTLYCTVQCMYEVTTLYCTVQCMYEVTTLYCTYGVRIVCIAYSAALCLHEYNSFLNVCTPMVKLAVSEPVQSRKGREGKVLLLNGYLPKKEFIVPSRRQRFILKIIDPPITSYFRDLRTHKRQRDRRQTINLKVPGILGHCVFFL